MKRKIALAAFMFATIFSAQAQEATVNTDYNRSGLSLTVVTYGDKIDPIVKRGFESIDRGDKFYINPLKKTYYPSPLGMRSDTTTLKSQRAAAAAEIAGSSSIAKEIMTFCFKPNAQTGELSDALLMERSNYNAKDTDYQKAVATEEGVEMLSGAYESLLNHNYVMTLDYTALKENKNDEGEIVSWTSTVEAHVYKVVCGEDVIAAIYDVWSDVKAFNAMEFNTVSVASVKALGVSTKANGGSPEKAVEAGYWAAMSKLENKISEWAVKAPVESVKPIQAKVGLKEGLKNRDRYFAYAFLYDEKSESEMMKRRGVVRATDIADNRVSAIDVEGQSPMSSFYQIAGAKSIDEGDLLIQKNDLGTAVSVGYNYMDLITVDVDYLININTRGSSQYALLTYGYNMYSDVVIDYYTTNMTAMRVGLGYGYGVRPFRALEVMPFAKVVGDYLATEAEAAAAAAADEDSSFTDKLGYGANVGVKFNINIAYPVQLYVQVDYTFMAYTESEQYYNNNSYLAESKGDSFLLGREGVSRDGLAFGVGLRYSF